MVYRGLVINRLQHFLEMCVLRWAAELVQWRVSEALGAIPAAPRVTPMYHGLPRHSPASSAS